MAQALQLYKELPSLVYLTKYKFLYMCFESKTSHISHDIGRQNTFLFRGSSALL